MPRRYVSQFGERETIDEVFLASEKQLRTNRNGNLYLQVRLSDRTGSMTAMMWNASDNQYGAFNNGDYLRVQGTTQFYNGGLQLILQRFETVEAKSVDEADFVTLAASDVDVLANRLQQLLRGLQNEHLRNLAECFLMDESFMQKFTAAPAGVKNHHAYKGGLLHHVVSLMELCAIVAPRYPDVDPDLLLSGAFLHDMGKIDELTYERELGYSDEGQLIGHVVIAVGLLNEKVKESQKLSGEEFPRELLLRLQHMIVSHHGEYQYGSPKLPMTLEAVALHYLDNLDAKLYSLGQLIRDDVNADSSWTPFQQNLQRKLFKGGVR
jgi:3'-5' exoribonuclease